MDKLARMALLYDFYSPLLTSKQRDRLDLYYQQDLSLAEIAEETGSTRQAVYDLLKRTEKILLEYEAKLGLVERYVEQRAKLLEINELLKKVSVGDSPIVIKLSEDIRELLAKD